MRKFISGLLIGLLITFGTNVFANDISKGTIANFTNFTFKVNGEIKRPQTSPVVINNVSYLPVRDVAGMLGYSVNYDATSKTIELNNKTNHAQINSLNENYNETSHDGFLAITDGIETYVEFKWFYNKLKEEDKENNAMYDPKTDIVIFFRDGKETKLTKQSNDIKIFKGRTFINIKIYE